jgi:hypothetical protein
VLWTRLIILLIRWVLGLPAYPYSRGWGYGPTGVPSVLLVIVLVLLLLGRV